MTQPNASRRQQFGSGAAMLLLTPFSAGPDKAAVAAIPQNSPDDAELIAACERHIFNYYATMNCEGNDDPRWDTYLLNLGAIGNAKPVSIAGLVAKARVAKFEAWQPDGTEDIDTMGGWLGFDLVNDLLRLHGLPFGEPSLDPPVPRLGTQRLRGEAVA